MNTDPCLSSELFQKLDGIEPSHLRGKEQWKMLFDKGIDTQCAGITTGRVVNVTSCQRKKEPLFQVCKCPSDLVPGSADLRHSNKQIINVSI